jgi:catechol 2,3-dioxygenase-like lactoylglutathione lyase family enzyme
MKMKLELVVLPVSDVDRAKDFYERLGFRLDGDVTVAEGFRVVHLTPPESECSIIFGDGVTTAPAGSVQGLYLIVDDIEAARADIAGRGVDISPVFHDVDGIFHHAGTAKRLSGPHPQRADYSSFASFSDTEGNGWVLQEVRVRAPGR